MVADVWSYVVEIVLSPVAWFTALLDAVDGAGKYLAIVVLLLVVRLFVYPLVGPAGSDTQTQNRKNQKQNSRNRRGS